MKLNKPYFSIAIMIINALFANSLSNIHDKNYLSIPLKFGEKSRLIMLMETLIGTPPKIFNLQIDTGSDKLWVT
jgi:hypothetical protein